MIECNFDGSLCPHLNLIGGGWTIEENGTQIKTGCDTMEVEGISANRAEYFALYKLLNDLVKMKLNKKKIHIYGDSRLVINQMTGRNQMSSGIYMEMALKTRDFYKKHYNGNIRFQWIPRGQNAEADRASRLNFPI